MKVFWILIFLLAVTAAVVMLRPKPSSPPAVAAPAPSTDPLTNPVAPAPRAASPQVSTEASPSANSAHTEPSNASSNQREVESPRAMPEASPISKPVPQPDPTPPSAALPAGEAAPSAPTSAPPVSPKVQAAEQAAAAAETRDISDTLDAVLNGEDPTIPAVEASPTVSGPAASPLSADPAAPAKIEDRPDGSKLIDGRFPLSGSGTKADPYKVTWEMLVSAEQSYQPRLGKKVIPSRLKLIHEKWVNISGYIAFPIMAQNQDEMLMMLNQWDGCCIGVPPTPYDAIEVKLARLPKSDDRLKVAGSITGLLKVDPYLVKDWLVSLYIMDDAELSTTQ